MTAKQKIYLKIGIIVPVVGLLLSAFYRPYIYPHNINDLGFADVIGSLVSVIGFCNFVWAFKVYSNKEMKAQIIFSVLWESFGYLGIYSVLFTFFIKQGVEKKI